MGNESRTRNAALAAVVPPEHRVELAGHAWQRFVDATAADVPAPLVDAVERVLALARA
jgi:hypothetical protein